DDNELWAQVEQWMRQHCINQLTSYNNRLADRPVMQQRARKLMIEQYQRITSVKDPEMRAALTEQASLRDNMFGIKLGYKHGRISRAEADARLQEQANKLADIEVFLREARIKELENEVRDLKVKRKDYMARVAAKELQEADLPLGKMNPATDYDAMY